MNSIRTSLTFLPSEYLSQSNTSLIFFYHSKSRLSISFRSARNGRNISYQFKKQNKTEQISSHFKSRPVPEILAKFRPKRSSFIPVVPFRPKNIIFKKLIYGLYYFKLKIYLIFTI